MEQFSKKWFKSDQFLTEDTGIKVSDLLGLISTSEFFNDIYNLLDIEAIVDDFIKIKGATTLVATIKELDKKFEKIDLVSDFQDITLFSNGELTLNFNNLEGVDYFKEMGYDSIIAHPIHSARRDFFSGLYNMDKYASRLIANGYKHILTENMRLLSEVTENRRKYRLLHDTGENKFYLRGIISTDHYNDYNNSIAVVVGLLTLHREMLDTGTKYDLSLCEYNESAIRMFFDSSEMTELEGIGVVKNIVEIANDEIKRESLKFLGVCSINYKNKDNIERELIVAPKEVKTKILSISHNQSPNTAMKKLSEIKNANDIHKEVFDDIARIRAIKKPEQIKFLIKRKVEGARRDELSKYKDAFLGVLSVKIENVIQLLEIFNKFNLIVDEDIEAKEFLRYLLYETIVANKK
ncbi:hypothetical protein BZG01_19955 [Labilibaculum manganireducens]|uniref:Uncharacterized protein n=1 Tax=Labilibaculum manganireducens TaxID=1940525 RepID=A0A2N3HSN9_9BACT|nr:hypothetical protein [Labilibaculum manganireducens]PKQ61070.1 hypothetical protein BZG01_19955 [Labilibaculum manganireducens]